jgi:hypothetical protein
MLDYSGLSTSHPVFPIDPLQFITKGLELYCIGKQLRTTNEEF